MTLCVAARPRPAGTDGRHTSTMIGRLHWGDDRLTGPLPAAGQRDVAVGIGETLEPSGQLDAELVELARAGDLDAFSRLTERYQDFAFRVALSVTGNAADAEDATQEGFVRAFRALDRFRAGAPFRPWVLKIVLNEARGRRRVGFRSQALGRRLLGEREELEADPMDHVLLQERRGAMATALRELQPDHRRVIYYRYFLDLSEEEMADALDCPRGTVKSRLSRALARLRQIVSARPELVR
jgi:RNA polymerase sigma factor (sigma-70 family)